MLFRSTALTAYSSAAYLSTYTNHPLVFETNNTERMKLDTSGNLGLGVTPSSWGSAYKALQVSTTSVSNSGTGNWDFSGNRYNNSGDKFIGNGYATMYRQNDGGVHAWFTSTASGTAGNAITFTQAMTLDASGNLGVGTTSMSNRLVLVGPANTVGKIGRAHV